MNGLPRKSYAPRLVAATMFGVVFGIYGGYVVCVSVLEQSPQLYWEQMIERVELSDIQLGVFKSFVFAGIVGVTGRNQSPGDNEGVAAPVEEPGVARNDGLAASTGHHVLTQGLLEHRCRGV